MRPSSRGLGPAERIDPDGLNSIRSLARTCRAGLGLSGWIGWAGPAALALVSIASSRIAA